MTQPNQPKHVKMEYTVDKKETQAEIQMTFPWSSAGALYDTAIEDAVKNVELKGFRKGHVPRDVAEEHIHKDVILGSVAEELLRKHFGEVLSKESLQTAGQPEVSVTKLAEGNDIEVSITVTLIPEITLPKSWKKTVKAVNKEFAAEDTSVSDEDIEKELAHLAESRAEYTAVHRAAADGDTVKVDFVVKQGGVIIENGTSTDHALVLGKGVFIPGFEEEVIGMTPGEEKTFTLTFPEQYHAEHLAGKEASFEVTLKSVEEANVPTIDDAFVATLGSEHKTRADLEKSIRDGMQEERKNRHEEDRKTAYITRISEDVDVTLPEVIEQDELARMEAEFSQQIAMSGMDLEQYLAQVGKTREEMQEAWKPQARQRVLNAMVLEALGAEMEEEPTAEEIEAEMNKTLSYYKGVSDAENQIDMQQLYAYTKNVARNDKVFERLATMV